MASQRLILCIEDEEDMLELMRIIITREGHRFISTDNGNEAVTIAQQHNPDLILLDLMMPDVSGWVVYSGLKSNPATAAIPVMIVTARSQADDRLTAFRLDNPEFVLSKPFSPMQLLQSIKRVFAM